MNHAMIIIISLLFSAFFSGMEIAYISANKLKIQVDKNQGIFGSGIISFFNKKPGHFIATMLVGNNIALVIYGIIMAVILEPLISRFTSSEIITLIIQTIISTLFILITAEFLPKTVFIINPNLALKIFAVPVIVIYLLLYPVTRIIVALSYLLIRIFTGKPIEKSSGEQVFGKIDLDHLLSKAQDQITNTTGEQSGIRIFQNVLDFSNIRLRDCMVPRNEIVSMDEKSPVEDIRQKFIETGLSKILIYRETPDNIVGYIHSREIFKNPVEITSKIINIPIVPETMPANKLLQSFISKHRGIALVVDEFGGNSGIVTIEDIIEEIFGEIEDEHDFSELTEKRLNDNEFIFSGRLEIDYLNDMYKLGIPKTDDYETLAGLILFYHESIPVINEKITIHSFIFKILEVSQTRIGLIHLIKSA
jgi:CBS domain containing-hemolysin-like protein